MKSECNAIFNAILFYQPVEGRCILILRSLTSPSVLGKRSLGMPVDNLAVTPTCLCFLNFSCPSNKRIMDFISE